MPDLFGEIEPGVAEVVPFDGGARAYSYSVPAALKEVLKVGQLVRVPLGGRTSIGVVWKYPAEPPPSARLRAAMGPGWYRRLVLPNLLTNYFVWFPGTLIFYSMPTDLQLVVANCIGCFWALMCARIAAHSGVPTTDVHA